MRSGALSLSAVSQGREGSQTRRGEGTLDGTMHQDIATYLGGDLLEHGETRRPNPIIVGDQDPHLPLSSQDL